MKIKGIKLRKNSTFKYVPRYAEKKEGENVYSIDSKFSKYRDTPVSGDIRGQWKDARNASRTKGNREINKRLLIIVAVLVFMVLWFFDFDLSIFIGS